MKASPLVILLGSVVAVVSIAGACLVDRKSDALACGSQADCTSPRVCEGGFCVIDPTACPADCASCDMNVTPHLCKLTQTTANGFTCPSGIECDITCATAGACKNITCDPGSVCKVDCMVGSSCTDITCSGRCDLRCDAVAACGPVSCSNACACDLSCGNGDCGSINCPREQGNMFCTASGNNGQACDSSVSSRCDSC